MRNFVILTILCLISVLAGAKSARATDACVDAFSAPSLLVDPFLLSYQNLAGDTGLLSHRVRIVNGEGYLKIGFMMARDREFSKASLLAVRRGLIAEIDAGQIFGPKVLPLLTLVARVNPSSHQLIIRGRFDASGIYQEVYKEDHGDRLEKTDKGETILNYRYFSKAELTDFEKAIEALKVKEACKELYNSTLENCGELSFEIDTQSKQFIKWVIPAKVERSTLDEELQTPAGQ